jgi:hypothetical protein
MFYSVCDCPKNKKLPLQGDYSKILRRDMATEYIFKRLRLGDVADYRS